MRKRILFCVIAVVLLVTGMTGCGKQEEKKEADRQEEKKEQTELYVLAAASMTDVMNELSKQYGEENPDIKLTFSFDSSGTLKTQIEQGAPANLFISAAMKQMDELNEAGLMKEDSITKLLENKVVLIKPSESESNITSFEDVVTDKVSMIAIGNEDVPVGQYTETIYTNLGLWEKVQEKANLATNVRQVLDWVATKNADCGIVYATDAMIEEDVTIVCEAPEGMCDKVIYPAGIVKAGGHEEETGQFMEFLKSDEAKAVFEKYGFTNYEE